MNWLSDYELEKVVEYRQYPDQLRTLTNEQIINLAQEALLYRKLQELLKEIVR